MATRITGNDVKTATVTADGALVDHPCRLRGLIVAGGSSDGSVIFYDNDSAASGTALLTLGVNANTNETLNIPDQGVYASNGIYADVTNVDRVTIFVS